MTERTSPVLRTALPAILLAAAFLIPFLNKAFTMDDTVFMREAMHALSDPLHPTAFEIVWTYDSQRLSTIVPTGPVMAWLLIPAAALGGVEWAAHTVQIVMLAIACIATVSIALRFGLPVRWAALSGLLLAATPAVLGMAGTAMPDVPAMAIGVAGMDRLLAWRQDHRWQDGSAAALLLACGVLTRSHVLLLLVPAALLLTGNIFDSRAWRQIGWRGWAPLLVVPLIVIIVMVVTSDPAGHGGTLAGSMKSLSSLGNVPGNAVAFVVHLALVIPFTIPMLILYYRDIIRSPVILVSATASAAALLWLAHGQDAPYVIALIAGLSVAAFAHALHRAVEQRDSIDLSLLVWMLVPIATAMYVHLPAKFLVPAAPAAALLVSRSALLRPRFGAAVLIITIAAGVTLGIAILRADARFAGFGREAVRTLIAPQVARGERVWFNGHWGFQWYAERAGARCLTTRGPFPAPGELVVSAERSESLIVLEEMKEFKFLQRLQDAEPGGRIMSNAHGAGFFSNTYGYLPWAWGTDVIEAIDVYRFSP